jgi:hypothetical protein
MVQTAVFSLYIKKINIFLHSQTHQSPFTTAKLKTATLKTAKLKTAKLKTPKLKAAKLKTPKLKTSKTACHISPKLYLKWNRDEKNVC